MGVRGVERESGEAFLVAVESRDTATLLPIIRRWILPGITIISDKWKDYECLQKEGYEHLTVNHSEAFKDPTTGAHTNTVEGMWRHAKASLPTYRRVKRNFPGYLAAFMFRRFCKARNLPPYEEFMEEVKKIDFGRT